MTGTQVKELLDRIASGLVNLDTAAWLADQLADDVQMNLDSETHAIAAQQWRVKRGLDEPIEGEEDEETD